MPHLDDISGWVSEKLPALLAEHKVPGAAIAVYAGGEVFDFASGVLSHATGVEATADSVAAAAPTADPESVPAAPVNGEPA